MSREQRILAVVVLYRASSELALEADLLLLKTVVGLERAFRENPQLRQTYKLLFWDNSPQPLPSGVLPLEARYHHAEQNVGVAGAYNGAAQIATEIGATWLLLLDDDTCVTEQFLAGMREHARSVSEDREIAAVVPLLVAGDAIISPQLWHFARHVALPRPATTYTERRAMFAANSGTLLRIEALHAVGGYNPRFWLDYSDIELFERVHRHGYAVRIASDLTLEHEIAMLDYDNRMTATRYASYLAAEGDFVDLYRGWLERALHLLRLAVRVHRQRRLQDPVFSRMSRQELGRRLRTRRSSRLWERSFADGLNQPPAALR